MIFEVTLTLYLSELELKCTNFCSNYLCWHYKSYQFTSTSWNKVSGDLNNELNIDEWKVITFTVVLWWSDHSALIYCEILVQEYYWKWKKILYLGSILYQVLNLYISIWNFWDLFTCEVWRTEEESLFFLCFLCKDLDNYFTFACSSILKLLKFEKKISKMCTGTLYYCSVENRVNKFFLF